MRSILRAFRTALVARRTDLLSDAPSFFHTKQQYVILFSFFFSLEFTIVTFKGEGFFCFVLVHFL